MKKSYFIFLLCVLCGCKKKSEQPTVPATIIEYNFTATGATSYKVYYTDANGQIINTTFTGSSWDKKISTNSTIFNATDGVKEAIFEVDNTLVVNPAITGIISILVNNKVVISENIKVLSAGGAYQIGDEVLN